VAITQKIVHALLSKTLRTKIIQIKEHVDERHVIGSPQRTRKCCTTSTPSPARAATREMAWTYSPA
jgi:hypothetical protein